MKICQEHWDKLKAAIDARSMGHLVAANGRDAFARAVSELKGTAEVDDFDPLMAAHNMIAGYCLDVIGLALMVGDLCPVCEILKDYPPIPAGHRYKSNEEYFIDGPADSALAIATARGLMS